MNIDIGKLQKVQDIISKYSILPIKIYSYDKENQSLEPLTSWSNPSFLHWLHDISSESKEDSFLKEFQGIASIIKRGVEDNLRAKLEGVFRNEWKNNPWEIVEFMPFDHILPLTFYIFPILNAKSGDSKHVKIMYIGISGGFFFSDRDKEADSLQNTILQVSGSLKKYEKRILLEELTEIPVLLKEAVENRLKSIRGCLTAFVSYYEDLDDDILEHLFHDLYRFSFKRNIWQRYFNILDKLLGDGFLGLVVSIYPLTKKKKYLQKIYGFGYPIFYELQNDNPAKEKELEKRLYIYSEENNRKFYLENDLSVIPEDKPWEKMENWIRNDKIHNKTAIYELTGIKNKEKLGSVYIFHNNTKKLLKKHTEKLNWITKFMSEEIYDMIRNTEKFKRAALNEYKKNAVELIKDLVAYAHLKEDPQLIDVIKRFSEIAGIKNLHFLSPAFFKGDGVFFNIETGEYETHEDVYENIFKKERPSFIKNRKGIVELYVSTTMTQKIIGILAGKLDDDDIETQVNEILDMMLVFSTILSPKILNLKLHNLNRLVEQEVQKIYLSPNFWIDKEFRGNSNKLAEEIAKLIGAHHVGLWIYPRKLDEVILWGLAGENFITLENRKIFEKNEIKYIDEVIDKGEFILKEKNLFILSDLHIQYESSIDPPGDEYFDTHILITISSNLDKFELTDEDNNILRRIIEQIIGLLSSKFSPVNERFSIQSTIDAVVHELMIPAVNLQHGLEYMMNKIFPKNDINEIVEFLKKDFTSDLERLGYGVNSLPILSTLMRDENIKYKGTGLILKKQFWGSLINTMKRIFFVKLKNKGMQVKFVFNPKNFPKFIVMDAEKFRAFNIVLYNLMENAIKYSREDTTILIKGERKDDKILLYFENEGIGVPEGEEERIFEKKVRGSNVEKLSRSGSGLGLFFARKVMESLGGEIKLIKNTSPTTFLLTLPIKYFQQW